MRTYFSASVAGIVLTLAVCPAPNASAQSTGTDSAQRAPVEQQTAPEEPKCVSAAGDFKWLNRTAMFEVALTNSCEKRFKCTVYAYVIGAQGPTQGKGSVILAPKSQGADSRKSYLMKVKQMTGSAYMAYPCKAI